MKNKEKVNRYIFEYNMGFITILSVVLLVVPILPLVILSIDFSLELNFDNPIMLFVGYVGLFILMFVWMIIHEIIHGVSYRLNGASKDGVTYGVALEKGIFYCKCSEFINRKNILISVIMPFLLIGVVTYVIGILIHSWILIILSIINISGAAGDISIFFFFLKQDKDVKFKELGDSTTFCLETKEKQEDKKYIVVKLKEVVESENQIMEEKSKFLNISKASKGILIAFFLFIAVMALLLLVLTLL